jgi:hypothetical protein
MKKLIFLLALIIFAVASCKEKKPADYTRLGNFTPYQTYMEKLNGKVESVIEKNYFAVQEGETYVKGAKMTKKELDSLGYIPDFQAKFDIDGDLISCAAIDENGKVIYKYEMSKENNVLAKAEYTYNDTLWTVVKLTCDASGNPVAFESFNAIADTLVRKAEVRGSDINDTIILQYYNSLGESGNKTLYFYNDLGLLTGIENIGKDGAFLGSLSMKYNDKGFISESTYLDKDKNTVWTNYFTYEYDNMGNWIKSICTDPKGLTTIGERVYTYFE